MIEDVKDEQSWYNTLSVDQANHKYQNWLRQAQENRELADLSLAPFQRHDGLISDKRDWVKSTSVRRIMRNIKARTLINPIIPVCEPFEGAVVEEDITKTCDALWRFERSDERGPKNMVLDAEINDWIDESMETGMGYIDARIDAALKTITFPSGLPVYESLDSTNVILDSRARRLKDIEHLHIISTYSPESFELIFDEKSEGFQSNVGFKAAMPFSLGTTDSKSGNIREKGVQRELDVVETQFRKLMMDELMIMPPELQKQYYLNLKPPGLIFKSEFKLKLEALKKSIPGFKYDLNKIIKGLERQEQLRWGWYSTFYVGNSKINKGKEYYIGARPTVYVLPFIRISQDSPYGWGAPHFLRDAQKMEVLVNTKLSELVMKSNKSRVYSKLNLNQDTKDAIADPRKDVVEIPEFAGDPRPLDELLKFETSTDKIPFLIEYRRLTHDILNEEYGTRREQEGSAPFAGSSGKLVNTLLATGIIMLNVLKENVESNMGKLFQRARNLATYALPPQSLIEIAGENDEDRARLIMSGDFYKRISRLNTIVKLDTTTREEQMFLVQLYSRLYETGQLDPLTFFSLIGELTGLKEPKKLADAVMTYKRATDAAYAVGEYVTQDPIARETYLPAIQNSIKTQQQINAGNTLQGQRGQSA
jgi:hypothetical protein